MKKFLKKFLKKNEGFTLVELVVVIAILGILAGVGTVGYSGYIKKANMAADETLLASLNTAFAAACIENGKDASTLANDSVTATLTDVDGGKELVSISLYDDEFDDYYEGGTFKVITALKFENGMFKDANGAGESNGGVYANLSFDNDDVTALRGSTFFSKGIEELLKKVNEVTDFVDELESAGAMNKVYNSSVFRTYFANMLGVTGEEGNTFDDKLKEYADKMGMEVEEAQGILSANAAVMFAANQTSGMTNDEIMTLLAKDDLRGSIITELGTAGNEGTALSHAALAYGMYYAYALDSGDETLINKTPMEVMDSLNEEGFKDYVKDLEDNNKSDENLSGFLGALNMINSSSSNTAAVEDLLMNGFSNNDLVAALKNATDAST